MRVLLLHPDDDFLDPWTREPWDLVVDLGRAPQSFYAEQSAVLGCPVYSIFDLAREADDLRDMRQLLAPGLGRVVDRFGIDWWDVITLMQHKEFLDVQLAFRLAQRLNACRTLAAMRHSLVSDTLVSQLGLSLQILRPSLRKRLIPGRFRRGAAAARNLEFTQLRQVLYDKYDPHYRFRRRLVTSPTKRAESSDPVVLLPSAYSNVTKTAFSYARLLPDQKFLLVLARESAAVSPVPPNVETVSLAVFAGKGSDSQELQRLENSWEDLRKSLREDPLLGPTARLNLLEAGLRWLPWGLTVRDAWLRVFAERHVIGCLSADDSNPYTRIPLLLADSRKIPAVACHHGALDYCMAFKNLRASHYLAKGEMECDYLERVSRVGALPIQIGASSAPHRDCTSLWSDAAPWITFFAEPYETDSWRVEPIYREVFPRLCAAARRAGKTVVIKLHPFESLRQRRRIVARCLSPDDQRLVTVVSAPLSPEILRNTWCAVTVESTVACECAAVGIPSFLCGWLRHAWSAYALQFVRFGVGWMLDSPDDLTRIPDLFPAHRPAPDIAHRLAQPIPTEVLTEVLCGRRHTG